MDNVLPKTKVRRTLEMILLYIGCIFLSLVVTGALLGAKWVVTNPQNKLNRMMNAKHIRSNPGFSLPDTTKTTGSVVQGKNQSERYKINTSQKTNGYITAECQASRTAVLILEKEGETYTEYLPADGLTHSFPLSMGNGHYKASLYLHKTDTLYEQVLTTSFTATIQDEFIRYTIPTPISDYRNQEEIKKIATQLYASSKNNQEFAEKALQWVNITLQYDISQLDKNDEIVYVPDLDRVLKEKTAICTDYASMYAAMLRVCGIPCQIVYGYVDTQEGEVYHAWNMVWLEDNDSQGAWSRFDATAGTANIEGNTSSKLLSLENKTTYNPPLFVR